MGEVYLAEDPQIQRQLAIKTLRLIDVREEEVEERKERLLREARTAGRLLHPNIVTLFDAGEEEGWLYLAFEYVAGSDLAARVQKGPPLTLGEALRALRETSVGLDYAHRHGVIHRDIKPHNLLLDAEGRVKISDFGIAKLAGQTTELTMTGSVLGSPHYLSPEQIRGGGLDGRSDLFSLGVVFYELLSGRRPFAGDTIGTLVYQILHTEPAVDELGATVPPRLHAVIGRLLAKDPDERFATAGEVAAEIAAAEAELGAAALAAPAAGGGVAVPAAGAARAATRAGTAAGATPGSGAAARPAGVAGVTGAPAPSPAAAVGPTTALPPAPAPTPPVAAATPSATGNRRLWIGLAAAVVAGGVLLGVGGFLILRSRVGPIQRLAGWLRHDRVESAAPVEGSDGTESAEGAKGASPADTGQVPPGTTAERESANPRPGTSSSPPPEAPPSPAGAASAPGAAEAGPAPSRPEVHAPAGPAPARPSVAPVTPAPPPARPEHDRIAVAPSPSPPPGPAAETEAGPAGDRRPAVDATITTGLGLSFRVEPDDAFVLLDGTVIGRASEFGAGSAYTLPGAGSYILTLRRSGMQDRSIRVQASAGGAAVTPVVGRLSPIAAAHLALGDLDRYQVREAVAFRVDPPVARVLVDGSFIGPAAKFSGGLRRGGWLELPPGMHRVSFLAPGRRRFDVVVEVTSGASEKRTRIDVTLPPARAGESEDE